MLCDTQNSKILFISSIAVLPARHTAKQVSVEPGYEHLGWSVIWVPKQKSHKCIINFKSPKLILNFVLVLCNSFGNIATIGYVAIK